MLGASANSPESQVLQCLGSTLHPTPYTLHPTPYTLHSTPFTLHSTPCTPHHTPHILHPTPFPLYPTPQNKNVSAPSSLLSKTQTIDGPSNLKLKP